MVILKFFQGFCIFCFLREREPAGVGRGMSPACCLERQFSMIVKGMGFHVGILDRVQSQVLALTLTGLVILEKLLDLLSLSFFFCLME